MLIICLSQDNTFIIWEFCVLSLEIEPLYRMTLEEPRLFLFLLRFLSEATKQVRYLCLPPLTLAATRQEEWKQTRTMALELKLCDRAHCSQLSKCFLTSAGNPSCRSHGPSRARGPHLMHLKWAKPCGVVSSPKGFRVSLRRRNKLDNRSQSFCSLVAYQHSACLRRVNPSADKLSQQF